MYGEARAILQAEGAQIAVQQVLRFIGRKGGQRASQQIGETLGAYKDLKSHLFVAA